MSSVSTPLTDYAATLLAVAEPLDASYVVYAQLTGTGWILHEVALSDDDQPDRPTGTPRSSDADASSLARGEYTRPRQRLDVMFEYGPAIWFLDQVGPGDGRAVGPSGLRAAVGVRTSDNVRVVTDAGVGYYYADLGLGVDVSPRGFRRTGPLVGLRLDWTIMPAVCPFPEGECRATRDTPAYMAKGYGVQLPFGWRFPLDLRRRYALTVYSAAGVAWLRYNANDYPEGTGLYAGPLLIGSVAFEL
jgi:hypothetical protein